MSMSTIPKAQQIKLINEAYYKLVGACEHTDDWDRYVGLVEDEEKEHRRFKPDGIACGLTKAQSVRLFVVKEVFDRFVPNESGKVFTPVASDYFHIKQSVFGACSIVERCGVEIAKAVPFAYMRDWLKAVDYVELNRDPRIAVAA